MPLRLIPSQILTSISGLALVALALYVVPAHGQTAGVPVERTPVAAGAATAVPALVPFSGVVEGKAGEAGITFLVYKDEQGGEPLWAESQTVALDEAGRFQVKLGATLAAGLPSELFASGEARWLEVQAAGAVAQKRVLMMSVPYALKAADATTLGGLPVSAFMLAVPGLGSGLAGPAAGPVANVSASTITGGGAAGYLPFFTAPTTVADSSIFESGSRIGINTTTPAAVLDVSGSMDVRGPLAMESAGTATASGGKNSEALNLTASTFSSTTGAATAPFFSLVAEPAANDTSAPAATLNVLYGNGGTAASTGLSISNKGILTFASGQTFPGTGTGTGTSTTIKAGNGLTAATSGTTETLAVDGTKVALLGAVNTFADVTFFTNGISSSSAISAAANLGDEGTIYGQNSSSSGYGVYGYAGGSGVYGASQGGYGVNGYSGSAVGVNGTSNSWIGTYGTSGSKIGLVGVLGSQLSQWGDIYINETALGGGGIEGDGGAVDGFGVSGTTNDWFAGEFTNVSGTHPTLIAQNGSGGGSGLAIQAGGDHGSCTIDTSGNTSCTGAVKALVQSADGTHTVETYSVQSSENWIEDFGSGTLSGGQTTIMLEPTFATSANVGMAYHVFITPRGDAQALYVSHATATSFEVHESAGGAHSIEFDYRIVARRQGHESERLVDVTERAKSMVMTRDSLKHKSIVQ